MSQPFTPLFSNPHLMTLAAHFWPRRLDARRFPVERRIYRTEPGVEVLAEVQRPMGEPRAELLLLHGLEGSSRSEYLRNMAQAALEAGCAVQRLNMRERYHAGLTSDLAAILGGLGREVFLVGYSLGASVMLKLAGELGEQARGLIAGVCAVSAPIDLAASVRSMEERRNRVYELRFLRKLKRRTGAPAGIRGMREFDDRITAPAFGFGSAARYYETQSALRVLDRIRVPALLIQAQDDPLVPFDHFRRLPDNPHLRLLAPEHGGHVGFLSRRRPRFWLDRVIVEWVLEQTACSDRLLTR